MNKNIIIGVLIVVIFIVLKIDFVGAQVSASGSTQPLDSPSKVCQYYQNRWEKGLIAVVNNQENDCLVKIGDNNMGIGYIHGYYSGSKFCLNSYGAYFNNAGVSDSTSCISVSRVNTEKQQNNTTKINTTPSSSKNSGVNNGQVPSYLNSIGNIINGTIIQIVNGLQTFFDNAINLFKNFKL